MPSHKYKGVVYERPKNLSNAMCKEIVDHLGGDYTFTINDVLKLLSDFSAKQIVVECDTTTKLQFMPEGEIFLATSKMSDLYERGAE